MWILLVSAGLIKLLLQILMPQIAGLTRVNKKYRLAKAYRTQAGIVSTFSSTKTKLRSHSKSPSSSYATPICSMVWRTRVNSKRTPSKRSLAMQLFKTRQACDRKSRVESTKSKGPGQIWRVWKYSKRSYPGYKHSKGRLLHKPHLQVQPNQSLRRVFLEQIPQRLSIKTPLAKSSPGLRILSA